MPISLLRSVRAWAELLIPRVFPQPHFGQSHIQFNSGAPLLDPQGILHLQREMAESLHAIQAWDAAIQKLSDRLDDALGKIEGLGNRVAALEVLNESQKSNKPAGNKKPKRTAEFNARGHLLTLMILKLNVIDAGLFSRNHAPTGGDRYEIFKRRSRWHTRQELASCPCCGSRTMPCKRWFIAP